MERNFFLRIRRPKICTSQYLIFLRLYTLRFPGINWQLTWHPRIDTPGLLLYMYTSFLVRTYTGWHWWRNKPSSFFSVVKHLQLDQGKIAPQTWITYAPYGFFVIFFKLRPAICRVNKNKRQNTRRVREKAFTSWSGCIRVKLSAIGAAIETLRFHAFLR